MALRLELTTPFADPRMAPQAINSRGWVVGLAGTSLTGHQGVLWIPGHGARTLNSLLLPEWSHLNVIYAWCLNDEGWVAARTEINGQVYGLVLEPVE